MNILFEDSYTVIFMAVSVRLLLGGVRLLHNSNDPEMICAATAIAAFGMFAFIFLDLDMDQRMDNFEHGEFDDIDIDSDNSSHDN